MHPPRLEREEGLQPVLAGSCSPIVTMMGCATPGKLLESVLTARNSLVDSVETANVMHLMKLLVAALRTVGVRMGEALVGAATAPATLILKTLITVQLTAEAVSPARIIKSKMKMETAWILNVTIPVDPNGIR